MAVAQSVSAPLTCKGLLSKAPENVAQLGRIILMTEYPQWRVWTDIKRATWGWKIQ